MADQNAEAASKKDLNRNVGYTLENCVSDLLIIL